MESGLLCVAAFVAVYWCTKRSLVAGLNAVLTTGYFYGIVRANLPETLTHFIFDAGLGGLYLATLFRGLTDGQLLRIRKLRRWVLCLVGWPILLFFIPVQDPMIQLVGLRGAIWFLPFLFFGAMIDDDERSQFSLWLAFLNVVALAFAAAEFSLGVEKFFPYNAVTELIYRQNDVVKGSLSFYRIPAIFVQQSAYSATMVLSMPLLAGAWVQTGCTTQKKVLLTAGITSAILGVFLGASRSQGILFLAQLVLLASLTQIRLKHLVALAMVAALVGYWIYKEPRLQRVTQLDFGYVQDRVHWSVNESFLDALVSYPLGNGLGGGGTSVPYFLQDRLKNPIEIENEYGRILLELGIPGLALWIAFILMVITKAPSMRAGPWRLGWRLSRATVALYFGTAFIGTGLLTAIPCTSLLLFMTGWLCAPRLKTVKISLDQADPWFGAQATG
jgi:hypothetical protein